MIYLPGDRQVTKFQKLVNIHWHFSQFHKQTNTVTLGRLDTFKIATRVGLLLNIHKQDCQLMTKHNLF